MNDIAQLVNTLKLSADDVKSYVYYDDETGIPNKVSSRRSQDTDSSIIEVPYHEVKDLMTGKRRMTDFRVEYDAALKHLKIKEIAFDDYLASVDDKLHQINENDNPDLKVTWDVRTNYWTIILSDELKQDKYLRKSSNDVTLFFSITSRNDPNVLYKTVSIKVKDLTDDNYQFYYEPGTSELSMYTVKYFQTYSFERV